MSNNNTSDSHLPTQGIVYPLSFLTLIKETRSLAELKAVLCIYGYDAIIGVQSEPLTFMDIVERTGLTKKSLSDGLRRAIERGVCKPREVNGTRYFLPMEKSKPHVHEHESITIDLVGLYSNREENHVHGEKSKPRQKIYHILLDEFSMSLSPRVAYDIALTPKYPLDRLLDQIRYTRWEIKRGENSDPARPIENPAGRLISRLRYNRPKPRGFSLETALVEDEGYSHNELYEAIYHDRLDIPEIRESIAYAAWLKQQQVRIENVLE